MGQVYTRESQPFQMNSEQRLYKLKKSNKRTSKQVDNDTLQSQNLHVKSVSKEMKVKIDKIEDSESEDESAEEQNQGSQQSVSSEEANSQDQNNDQNIDDISPRNTETQQRLSKSSSTKKSTQRRQSKSIKTNIFVGTLGYGNYLEYTQQNYTY